MTACYNLVCLTHSPPARAVEWAFPLQTWERVHMVASLFVLVRAHYHQKAAAGLYGAQQFQSMGLLASKTGNICTLLYNKTFSD